MVTTQKSIRAQRKREKKHDDRAARKIHDHNSSRVRRIITTKSEAPLQSSFFVRPTNSSYSSTSMRAYVFPLASKINIPTLRARGAENLLALSSALI